MTAILALAGACLLATALLLPLMRPATMLALQSLQGAALAVAAAAIGVARADWPLAATAPLLLALQGVALPWLLRRTQPIETGAPPHPWPLAAATLALVSLAAAALPAGTARTALLPAAALLTSGLLTMTVRRGAASRLGLMALLQAPLYPAIAAPAPELVAILSPALAAVAAMAIRRPEATPP